MVGKLGIMSIPSETDQAYPRTPDGSTILAQSSLHRISAFVLPSDLLDGVSSPADGEDDDLGGRRETDSPSPRRRQRPARILTPTSVVQLPEASHAGTVAAPYFAPVPGYAQALVGCLEHPIQLLDLLSSSSSSSDSYARSGMSKSRSSSITSSSSHSLSSSSPPPPAAHSAAVLGTYRLMHGDKETVLSPASLLWPAASSLASADTAESTAAIPRYFVAGSQSLLALFDIASGSSAAAEPVHRFQMPRRGRPYAGVRGTVSALGAQYRSSGGALGWGLVAAGTWSRQVGLYDFAAGECAAVWSLRDAADLLRGKGDGRHHSPSTGDNDDKGDIAGQGVMQTIWSPCGRYLVVCERRARGMLLYDVRVTGRLLGWLRGRDAVGSAQRLQADVFAASSSLGGGGTDAGFELWSGSMDGSVKVWEGVGTREGVHDPSHTLEVAEVQRPGSKVPAVVSSAMLHPSGSVLATSEGSWYFEDGQEDADDYALKLSSSAVKVWSVTSKETPPHTESPLRRSE